METASFEEMGIKNTILFFIYLTAFGIVYGYVVYYSLKWLVKKYPKFKYTDDELEKMNKENHEEE